VKAGVFDKLKELAGRRKLEDLTITPVLTWNNKKIQEHIDKLLKIEGAYVAWGGKPLTNHTIPEIFGSFEPTAVFVPLNQILKEENFHIVTSELFGPFQVVTSFKEEELDDVIQALEKMENHLTAAVVSSDQIFLNKVLGSTVNGTTYAGLRARTTGAPQNHWFGPSGDPRGAGIGSPVRIKKSFS
jgi:1-pyrroline-5-carboxylate dehydrogenase